MVRILLIIVIALAVVIGLMQLARHNAGSAAPGSEAATASAAPTVEQPAAGPTDASGAAIAQPAAAVMAPSAPEASAPTQERSAPTGQTEPSAAETDTAAATAKVQMNEEKSASRAPRVRERVVRASVDAAPQPDPYALQHALQDAQTTKTETAAPPPAPASSDAAATSPATPNEPAAAGTPSEAAPAAGSSPGGA